MIDKLTSEQEAYLPVFRERWFNIGSSIEPMDRATATDAVNGFYATIGKPSPNIIWASSPFTAHIIANMLGEGEDSLGDSLWVSLWDSLWTSLGDSLRDSLWASLGASLRDSLWVPLGDSFRASLRASLGASLRDSLGASKLKYILCWFWGQADVHWLAFYLFCHHIGVKYKDDAYNKLQLHRKYCQSAGCLYPYENIAIVCDRPCEINWNHNKTMLHNDGGMAVKFRDGWGFWSLNGVLVPQWLAETEANQINPRKFAEIENAEIRREFVRKIGVERIAQHCGAELLDTMGDYQLIRIDLGGETGAWPYLKMQNPSIGVWHLECVGRECQTVQQAINFRASRLKTLRGDWQPQQLT